MSILPIRYLGKHGVLTDVDPFELPPEAMNFAKNVRYENTRIERGGVFRTVGPMGADPRHIRGYFDSNGNNNILYADSSGKLHSWASGTETDITVSGWTPTVSNAPTTSVVVNNMIYVNRPDHVPWYRSKDSSAAFTAIPTGGTIPTLQWDTTYRCQSLRGMNGVLVAFNVTKGAQAYPTMVKWSNFTSYNAGPADWDVNSTTSSAGENILAQMKGQILDGLLLRDRMMIYGTEETWYMDYIGGNNIFAFDRLFDTGVMSQNCVVEHDGLHYIFGNNDIKRTDGISPQSLADGKVRRFIYDSMVKAQSWSFFTAHNPLLNEVMFCYVSTDPYCTFPSSASTGCNRAAIYNYAQDVWYFADLPYVFHADLIQPVAGAIWSSETMVNWTIFGGSWAAQAGDPKLNLAFAGVASGNVTRSLRTFDRVQSVSTVYPIDPYANSGAYIERDDLNLDAIKASLRGYKLVSSIYPQGRLATGAMPLRFSVGLSDHPNVPPAWGLDQTFDQSIYYKLDYNMAGRYLSYRMFQDDFLAFSLTGFDADVTLLGEF